VRLAMNIPVPPRRRHVPRLLRGRDRGILNDIVKPRRVGLHGKNRRKKAPAGATIQYGQGSNIMARVGKE